MAIVVYIYETKKQARVPAFSSLFFVWLLLGDSQSFEWHLPKGNPQPFEGQGGHRKEINDNGKEINASKRHLRLIFLEKVREISTKTQENTRALSETEEHTRARERERERKKAHGEKFSSAFFFTVVFVGFTRGGGGRARRRPSLSVSN